MPGRRPPFRRAWRGDLVGFTLIALVLMTVYSFYARTQRAGTREIKYSELLAAVSAGRVREVSVVQKELTTVREVQGKYKVGTPFFANSEACGRAGGADCVRLQHGVYTALGVIPRLPELAPRHVMTSLLSTWEGIWSQKVKEVCSRPSFPHSGRKPLPSQWLPLGGEGSGW